MLFLRQRWKWGPFLARRTVASFAAFNSEGIGSGTVAQNHAVGAARLSSEAAVDQEEIANLARDFSRRELLPFAAGWEAEQRFPVETLRKAAELGFAGIYVSSDMGGSDLSCRDAALIFESLAYGDIPTTAFLTIHNMVTSTIDSHGHDDLRKSLLPKLTAMELFASYCLTEPNSGSDAASLTTSAVRHGDEYIINGSKSFTSGGGLSDIYLVMARTSSDPCTSKGQGVSAFIVEKGLPGLSFGKKEDKMGWRSQPTTNVNFDNVTVPKTALLGKEGSGFKIAMRALDRGRINIAACAVGGAQFCADVAKEYSKSRKQFGKSIGSFQSTQFKLADMATSLQASRLLVHNAAESMDNRLERATLDAAMAKRFATDAAFQVSTEAMQILGGYGYLRDYPIERYFRDLRVMSILEGTNEIMRVIIHRELDKLHEQQSQM
ncbi:hypothetical protein BSKO_00376 [Bryopsis sp. KO-2023]|nr:hypothetical protein BSKO_00376 [Bryopsis sp. KO-2023]